MSLKSLFWGERKLRRKSEAYLEDILISIERVENYLSGFKLEKFAKNDMVIDAVMRNLEIIGEAATQLPQMFKEKHSQVPWRDIQDFRIVVAHHYWKIHMERIWDIIEHKLEPLQKQVQEILKKEKK